MRATSCKETFLNALNFFEIIWIKNGDGILTVDLQKHRLSENAIFRLTPGQYRRVQLAGPLAGYYISLSREFLYLIESHVDFSFLAAQYGGKWNLPLIYANAEIEEVIVRMYKEYSNHHSLRWEILRGLVKVFMIYLSRQIQQEATAVGQDKDTEIVRKFMSLLKKHFASKKLVADYADELCITPNYLNSIVKRLTGFPASHHIQQYIIMEAKRQAMYSSLRMKEVADMLGFDDYAHFSKFFKNYSGINYSSFKKGCCK